MPCRSRRRRRRHRWDVIVASTTNCWPGLVAGGGAQPGDRGRHARRPGGGAGGDRRARARGCRATGCSAGARADLLARAGGPQDAANDDAGGLGQSPRTRRACSRPSAELDKCLGSIEQVPGSLELRIFPQGDRLTAPLPGGSGPSEQPGARETDVRASTDVTRSRAWRRLRRRPRVHPVATTKRRSAHDGRQFDVRRRYRVVRLDGGGLVGGLPCLSG